MLPDLELRGGGGVLAEGREQRGRGGAHLFVLPGAQVAFALHFNNSLLKVVIYLN